MYLSLALIICIIISTTLKVNKAQLFKIAFKDFDHITMEKIKQHRYFFKLQVMKEMEVNLVKNEEWQRKWQERRRRREEDLKKIREEFGPRRDSKERDREKDKAAERSDEEEEKEDKEDVEGEGEREAEEEEEDEGEEEEDGGEDGLEDVSLEEDAADGEEAHRYGLMESGPRTTLKQRHAFSKMRAAVRKRQKHKKQSASGSRLRLTDFQSMKNSGEYTINKVGSRSVSPQPERGEGNTPTPTPTTNNKGGATTLTVPAGSSMPRSTSPGPKEVGFSAPGGGEAELQPTSANKKGYIPLPTAFNEKK